jgi:hypothetical protein
MRGTASLLIMDKTTYSTVTFGVVIIGIAFLTLVIAFGEMKKIRITHNRSQQKIHYRTL